MVIPLEGDSAGCVARGQIFLGRSYQLSNLHGACDSYPSTWSSWHSTFEGSMLFRDQLVVVDSFVAMECTVVGRGGVAFVNRATGSARSLPHGGNLAESVEQSLVT